MTASTSAAARPTPGKAALARATILGFLFSAAPSSPLSSEALIQRMNAARIGVRDPDRPVLLVSSSGTRTRIDELTKLGYVEVADSAGRTIAGNACRRYRLTPTGRSAVLCHMDGGIDLDALAGKLAEEWARYRASTDRPEPAKLLAEVVPGQFGGSSRVEVRLVEPDGSEVVGWLDRSPKVDLIAALVNGSD